jgi:hypothetical protein
MSGKQRLKLTPGLGDALEIQIDAKDYDPRTTTRQALRQIVAAGISDPATRRDFLEMLADPRLVIEQRLESDGESTEGMVRPEGSFSDIAEQLCQAQNLELALVRAHAGGFKT